MTWIAQEQGLRVGSAGTHPFSLFERQRITARDRYRNLVDQMQYVARRELIFGLHVHVAVGDPDTAIQVVNGLLSQLAPLLALSASSPFWRGEPTGLASSRQMVFAAFPRSGPPPRFENYAEYAEVVGQLEKTGCIADYTHIWWDIRPHPRLGTVEVRICDAVTRLEDAIAITAYVQALVKLLSERHEARRDDPDVPPHPHDREQVARRALRARGAGDGPRDRQAEPHSRRAARPADAEGDRAARARARRRAGARGHSRHPRAAATARTGSCASSTRTATSSRSCRRSRTRPRSRPSRRDPSSRNVGQRAPDARVQRGPGDDTTIAVALGRRPDPARLLPLRLVVDLNGRAGAPA